MQFFLSVNDLFTVPPHLPTSRHPHILTPLPHYPITPLPHYPITPLPHYPLPPYPLTLPPYPASPNNSTPKLQRHTTMTSSPPKTTINSPQFNNNCKPPSLAIPMPALKTASSSTTDTVSHDNFHNRQESAQLPPFKKVLYLNQPYPDNYVPPTFLSAMILNHNIETVNQSTNSPELPEAQPNETKITFPSLMLLTFPILLKIACVAIWLSVIYSLHSSFIYNNVNPRAINGGLTSGFDSASSLLPYDHLVASPDSDHVILHNNNYINRQYALKTNKTTSPHHNFPPSGTFEHDHGFHNYYQFYHDLQTTYEGDIDFIPTPPQLNTKYSNKTSSASASAPHHIHLASLLTSLPPIFTCPHRSTTIPLIPFEITIPAINEDFTSYIRTFLDGFTHKYGQNDQSALYTISTSLSLLLSKIIDIFPTKPITIISPYALELEPSRIGHALCYFQYFVKTNFSYLLLFYTIAGLATLFAILFVAVYSSHYRLIVYYVMEKFRRNDAHDDNVAILDKDGSDANSATISTNNNRFELVKNYTYHKTWKTLIKSLWNISIFLFFLTPTFSPSPVLFPRSILDHIPVISQFVKQSVKNSLQSILSPQPLNIFNLPPVTGTTLYTVLIILVLITLLSNDYSNYFDYCYLNFSPKGVLMYHNTRLLHYTGYIHIHTHMTYQEIVEKFNHPFGLGNKSHTQNFSINDGLPHSPSYPSILSPQFFAAPLSSHHSPIHTPAISHSSSLHSTQDMPTTKQTKIANNNQPYDCSETTALTTTALDSRTIQSSPTISSPNSDFGTFCDISNTFDEPLSNSEQPTSNNNIIISPEDILPQLHFPNTFSTIFSLNIIISMVTSYCLSSYLLSIVTQQLALYVHGDTTVISDKAQWMVLDPILLQDNVFIFITFSTFLLSTAEILYYLCSTLHHTLYTYPFYIDTLYESLFSIQEGSTNPTTPINNMSINEFSQGATRKNKVIKNLNTMDRNTKTSFVQIIYYIITLLAMLLSILLLTCHSPIQTYALIVIYGFVSVIAPLMFLTFRTKIPHWKRVIRGPWDYDDQNEVGKDNI